MGSFLVSHSAELWSLGAAVFSVVVNHLLRLRPRLRYSITHSTAMVVDQPLHDPKGQQVAAKQLLRLTTITIGNGGLQSAKGVELTFAFKPVIYNVRPMRRFEENVSGTGQFTLSFTSLAPSETLFVDIVAINADLPILTAVRADECVGKSVPMEPSRVWPTGVVRLLQFLLFLGLATAIYLTAVLFREASSVALQPRLEEITNGH